VYPARSAPNVLRSLLVIILALAALIAALGTGSPASANHDATFTVLSNGVVQLGVWSEGHLNVPAGIPSSGGVSDVGLRYLPTNSEATAPGCLCEGWGAADAGLPVTGHANAADGLPVNMTQVSFTSDGTTAVSVVDIGTALRVTHNFHPSPATPNLYEVDVTILNVSGVGLGDVRYRRVMDWDVEPTAFSEFSTIETGTSTALLFSSDDGFASSDPLAGPTSISFTGEAVDSGPADHGALFDFGFGSLAVGASHNFKIYYGAGATEAEAVAAVTAVGAEVFSFGQPSTEGGATLGTPNTFIFAFSGVGGGAVFTPSPSPASETPTPTPTATPAPTPAAATVPNTSAGGQGGVVVVLAIVTMAGLAVVGWRNTTIVRRRRAR
jgi:hypothetical protein